MKTPIRTNSPQRKTPSAAKEGRKSGLRTSGIKPFNRVDTNMQKSSSRKSIKQHASSQSKKQQELYGGVISSFRNSSAASPFPSTADRRPMTSHHPASSLYTSNQAGLKATPSQTKRVPTRQSISGTKTNNGNHNSRQAVKKTPSNSSIFTSMQMSSSKAITQSLAHME